MQEFGVRAASELLRPPGPQDSKYTRGVVGLITGSDQYPGAAVLGVEGAARAGAGYVRYVGPRRCQDLVLSRRPETVLDVGSADAWVVGSGMSDISESDPRRDTIVSLLDPASSGVLARNPTERAAYTVVDAGALREFARLEARTGDRAHERFVVTPHSGELATILSSVGGYSVTHADIDADADSRLSWAQRARDVLGCTVVLKGAVTLVVPVDREPLEIKSPTYWLSTAGTGDVLAGIMGTVVAQMAGQISAGKVSLAQAAATAVVLHGYAAGLASAAITSDEDPQDAMSLMLTTHTPGQPIVACDVARAVPVVIGALLAMKKARAAAAPIGFRTAGKDSAQ